MKHFAPFESDQKITVVIKQVIKDEKSKMTIYFIASLIMMLIIGATPYIWGKFVELISLKKLAYAPVALIVVQGLSVCEIVVRYILDTLHYKIENSTRRALQIRVTNDIVATSYSTFEKMNTGSVLTKINSDINVVTQFIAEDMLEVILCLVNVLFYVAIITTQSIFFLVLILTNCVINYMLNKRFGESNQSLYRNKKESDDKYQHIFYESISNFIEIKSFGLESIFKKKLSRALGFCEIEQSVLAKARNSQETLIRVVNVVGECIYMALGFVFVKNGWISLAMFIALFNYSGMLKMNIFSFSRMISNIRTLSVSFERVDDILVEETVGVNGFELKEPIERIKLSQVNFGYGKGKSVINNFTHQFEKGKIYIFAGKNGSGKSTLLKLLRGLYTCTSGQILVNDMLVQDIHPDDKKQMMTFLCQEGSLFNDTLISNITRFDNEPDLNQVNEIIAFLKLKEHLEIESTDEFIIDDKGHNVSGGQKQLINIARFMYQRSPIILLDELTSALDVHKTELVSKLLNQIKKDHIILIATHDPEIFKVADQVCYFCGDGSITTYDSDDWPQRYEIENAVVHAGVS